MSVRQNAGNFFTSWVAVSFLNINLLYAITLLVNDKISFRSVVLKSCAWVKFCVIYRCVGIPAEHLWDLLCPTVLPCVCTHITVREPLNGLWNLLLLNFMITCWVNSAFIYTGLFQLRLYMEIYMCLWAHVPSYSCSAHAPSHSYCSRTSSYCHAPVAPLLGCVTP